MPTHRDADFEFGTELPPEELRNVLVDEMAWVRIAAVKADGAWSQSLLDVATGAEPPCWQEVRWEYPNVLFVATEVHGSIVASWLENNLASMEAVDVQLPPLSTTIRPQRLASGESHGYEPLRWPSVNLEVADGPLVTGPSVGELLADGAPSFLNFATAARYFFGLREGGPAGFDHYRPVVRWQDQRGRIAGVRISAAEVEIELDGEDLRRSHVEIAGDAPGPTLPIGSERTFHIPLPAGLPPGAWVAVRDRSDWLDRRFLDRSRVTSLSPDVEIAVEGLTDVEALVAGGEGSGIEFKEELPPTRDARRAVARTVAAFANGSGGTILFGVCDDGAIVGVPTDGRRDPIADVSAWVKDIVVPVPEYDVRAVEAGQRGRVEERAVVVLQVEPGRSRPYGVEHAKPTFYVRRGSTTFPATQEQIQALARVDVPTWSVHGIGSHR